MLGLTDPYQKSACALLITGRDPLTAMHHFRSESTIWRLRIAAILLCAKCLLVPAGAGVLGYSILVHDDGLTVISLGIILLAALVALLQWLVSQRTHCPLCMTPVLAAKECAKHRRARTFLGSHRLRISLAVLFRGRFLCPYCNERSELVTRKPRVR